MHRVGARAPGSQGAVQREAGGCFVFTKQLACAAPATVKRTNLLDLVFVTMPLIALNKRLGRR